MYDKASCEIFSKRWVGKHKNDSLVMNVTDKTISGIELYTDLGMYIILYGLFMFIWTVGIPVGVLYLSGMSIGWTVLSFFLCLIIGVIFTIALITGLVRGLHKEIIELVNEFKKRTRAEEQIRELMSDYHSDWKWEDKDKTKL